VDEALQIGVDIGVRALQRMTHAGLRREMNDERKAELREHRPDRFPVDKIQSDKGETAHALQDLEPRLLEPRIVVVVQIVEADHSAAGRQEALCDVKSDEAGNPGHQYRAFSHVVPSHRRHRSMPEGFAVRSSFNLTSSTRPTPSFSSVWMRDQPPLTY